MAVYTSSWGKSSPFHSYPLTTFHMHLRSWKKRQQMRRHKKLCSILKIRGWPVPSWSVFNQAIWTNNDVEGWHHKLNWKARKGNLQFYLLITLKQKTADTDEDDLRGKTQKIQTQKEPYRPEPVVSLAGEVQQQPSRHVSSPEELWCNLQSRVLDFEHVYYILYILMWNIVHLVNSTFDLLVTLFFFSTKCFPSSTMRKS